jgi:hypothetical protein
MTTGFEGKLYIVFEGEEIWKDFHHAFNHAIFNLSEFQERPCDLKLPDNAKLYYDAPGKKVEGVFIYKGHRIRIKPSFCNDIILTSYDSDRTILLERRKEDTT